MVEIKISRGYDGFDFDFNPPAESIPEIQEIADRVTTMIRKEYRVFDWFRDILEVVIDYNPETKKNTDKKGGSLLYSNLRRVLLLSIFLLFLFSHSKCMGSAFFVHCKPYIHSFNKLLNRLCCLWTAL